MKIYTKTGDRGDTGLLAGGRVRKSAARIEAYGTVDELNAALGVARAAKTDARIDAVLARVQNDLFDLGAELASPKPPEEATSGRRQRQVAELEADIDQCEAQLPPLKQFILPGGSEAAALLHLARTICRRAERWVVRLSDAKDESVADHVIVYLNRLSDLLFVLARSANAAAGVPDVPWVKSQD